MVPIDVDLQDPPEALPGDDRQSGARAIDVVYGVRDNRETDSLPKRLTADLYYRAHNWLSERQDPRTCRRFPLARPQGGRRDPRDARAQPLHEGAVRLGRVPSAAVPYHREERKVGTTKFNYWKLWTLAIDGITSASTVPLRVWSYLGGLVALGALGYAIFIIVRTLISGIEVPGYASLMVAILFLGGLQLLSLGVLGEYVGRILTEAKDRPLYVVRETDRRRLMERAVFDRMAELDQPALVVHRAPPHPRRSHRADRQPADRMRAFSRLGCGTGHNLDMLARFGSVEASELDDHARELASKRLGRPVAEAALPDLSMFPGRCL